ncbi:ABC transporter substrate-binding protein [Alkalicoccobacillus gibsonii]|uniref:ABC transporter substrate-binding protein n=1 Tax=Alkalicoccobacillus gibsonii TaxID=79881 RepID=UPI00193430D2|nr:extracellular solute-binding protein [Alkalicoccobacillus gibsonii]MBM0065446.1 extracellular solute-binding protein [Alkalicoccobacillus gibsonii]
MNRKWFVFGMASVLALGVAACSGEESSTGSNSSGDEDVTLKFVHWINEENGNWEPLIERYEAENLGIKVESMPLVENMNSQDYYKQLDLMAAAGEDLDIVMFSNPNDFVSRINAGLLEPLNPYFDEEGIDINEEYTNSYQEIDGSYYGVPMKQVSQMILLNKDHLDEAGLDIPTEWTWDDYRDYAKQLTTDDHYGSYLHTWHNNQSSLKLFSKIEGDNGLLTESGDSNMKDPLVRESLELRYALENEDKSSVPFSSILSQQMDYRQQFFTEEASMVPIASFMLSEWGQFTPEFEMAWAPWPQLELTGVNYSAVGGDALSVAKSSNHKQEAYDFIRWLTTEGIVEQGIWMPSWNDANIDEVVESIAAGTRKPEALHLESIIHTLDVEPIRSYMPAPYITEVHTAHAAEVERYLLGDQDIDTTIENLETQIQNIADSNK